MRGACGRARPTGPDLKWAFCDVIGVYRDLIEFPQGKKRVFPWLKTVKKRELRDNSASGFWCGYVPRIGVKSSRVGTRFCDAKRGWVYADEQAKR